MTTTFNHLPLSVYMITCDTWPPPQISISSDWEECDDEKLLKIYQTGNRMQKNQAFSAIFNRYRLEVNRYIRGFALSEWQSKEVFTEVWTKASEKFKTFTWQGKPLNRWLIVTAKYTASEHRKQKKRQSEIVDQLIQTKISQLDDGYEAHDSTIKHSYEQETDQRFQQIIKMLENKLQRQILQLIYFNGITKSNQIATILGQKPNTIRANHRRALKKLAKLLSESHQVGA